MRKLKFVFWGLAIMGIIGYACKKEPVDSKIFVERYLAGTARWPIQSYVKLELQNADTLLNDTAALDTAIFSSDLKFIKGEKIVDFVIDGTGDNITFATEPDSTWRIEYLRPSSFKLVHQRQETVGTDIFTYKIEQVFIK